MDINRIYEELDSLKYSEIEEYLSAKINEAITQDRFDIVIPLLNEMIGFLRDTTQFSKGTEYKNRLIEFLEKYNQQGTMNYATSFLNIANFDRAMGAYEESLKEYHVCEDIYKLLLPQGDYLWAGLYNNESLLYQMMGDNLAAIGALSKALGIVLAIPSRRMEVATTYTNIAQSLAALGQMEEAEENVTEALKIFAEDNNQDYHFSAAAAVMGIIEYNRGNFAMAADWYDKAADMVKRIMGENENYQLLISNRDAMYSMMPQRENDKVGKESDSDARSSLFSKKECGMNICREFYYEYGKPMIEEKFAAYKNRITVGLFGEGSECLGFDDEYSRDHDWGPGFMLLVSRRVYGEIGVALERAYSELPAEYMGYSRNITDEATGRIGVIIIEDYLTRYMGEILISDSGRIRPDKLRLGDIPEYILCNITNGEIWQEGEGIIEGVRNELRGYYDDNTWKKKLAIELIKMGQSGQYNLNRCLNREDKVTAMIYLGEYITSTLKVLYLINRQYAPYEKWLMRGASELLQCAEVTDCIRAIADMDIKDKNLLMTIEIIAQIILAELKGKGLVKEGEDNWYLERIGKDLL